MICSGSYWRYFQPVSPAAQEVRQQPGNCNVLSKPGDQCSESGAANCRLINSDHCISIQPTVERVLVSW